MEFTEFSKAVQIGTTALRLIVTWILWFVVFGLVNVAQDLLTVI